MTRVLLTGAGFSRNWGGMLAGDVFPYLLGCDELDDELRRQLWRDRSFEDVLAALQLATAEPVAAWPADTAAAAFPAVGRCCVVES